MPLFEFNDKSHVIKSKYIAPEPLYSSFSYHYYDFCDLPSYARTKEFLEDVNKLFTEDLLELVNDKDLCRYSFQDFSGCWEMEFALDAPMPVGAFSLADDEQPTRFLKIEGEIGRKSKMVFYEETTVTKEELLERMK